MLFLPAVSANFSVVQFPSEVVAIIGEDITLNCAFFIQTGRAPSARGAMSWFKGLPGAESAVDKGHRYNISYPNTFLSSGEGSLIITNVSLEDTGRYTCKMMVWGLGEVRGNGINLQVYARPSHPIIFLQIQTEPKPSWTLVCRTHGFYPASVQLTWYLSRQKLPSSQQNWTDPAGFHQASSFLDLPYPHQKTSYTCNLEHPSLIGPINVQYFYGE
nr:PREDICTED: natural cytotoxicity triggering receptor 3 ligand 1-like [Anolis carolinensis]|eukprot:XP_016851585.1 PREDICTED: natural cytotoxicity triggering receptor 3 ligand 1-like [Anolis carolinensis]